MATELTVPEIGESIATAFIGTWLKKAGDAVQEGESIVEMDSDKASLEVPSPTSGVITELKAEEGDEVEIGAVIAIIDETADASASGGSSAEESSDEGGSDEESSGEEGKAKSGDGAEQSESSRQATSSEKGPQTGPAARRAASKSGVDIKELKGTGPHGRVTSKDVEKAAKSGGSPSAPTAAVDNSARTERVAMSPLRRTIARRLVEAQQTAAMLTTFQEVDMSHLMEMRKKYQPQFVDRYGFKLGFMSFFVKAAIESLKQYPAVNAELDGNDIVYKNYYNVAIAVSGPKGLVVPVVRDADRLSFAETENAIAELANRARDNKLSLEDFKDGTFTISNGGVFGSMLSTPILNPPQVAILGMHNIVKRPWVVEGDKIEVRPIMYLALSYDHRIIDGREAVSFLKRIKELIEDPERILLEV